MSPRYQLAAGFAGLLALASCSDAPVVAPGTESTESPFDVTLEYYSGEFQTFCARSGNDVYAGGYILAHWDGEHWRPLPVPRHSYYNERIEQIWFTANGDLNLDVRRAVWRFNGTAWDHILTGYPNSLWGAPDGTLFAAEYEYMRRFDGSVWAADTISTSWLTGVWGETSHNVYASGERGFIAHFDGHGWTPMPTDSNAYLSNVWRIGDGPMYARDGGGRLFRVNGETLTPLVPGTDIRFDNVWPTLSGFFAAGRSYEPEYHGVVYHYDGTSWEVVVESGDRMYSVTVSPDGTVFMGGVGGVWMRRNGTNEQVLRGLGEDGETLNNMWLSPEGDVIAIGAEAFKYTGGEWLSLRKEDLTAQRAFGVSGRSSSDFYVVGERMIIHYDGQAWDWVNSGFQTWLSDVWAGIDEVLAVGLDGRVVRMRSGVWDLTDTGTARWLFAVSGWDDGAYAVGEDGIILRYDGTTWTPEESPTNVNLNDVFAFADGRAVAVGDDRNAVFVNDGRSWSRQPIGIKSGARFYEVVQARSFDHMFVGGNGSLLQYQGGKWTLLSAPLTDETFGIAVLPEGDLIVSGNQSILRYRRR